MFNIRTTALALAAIASIGAASFLSSSSAEARGFGGGFSRGGGGGVHIGMRVGGGGHVGGIRRIGGGPRFVGHIRGPRFVGHRPHFRPNWCRLTHRCGPHIVRWHRPWIYGVGAVATTYAVTPAVAAAPRCTCLTKEYTPDNLVVFQDVCTKEVASAPIGNTQAQLPLPQQQAPVQQ
jgi:hypothetical protein